ncbi:hypothetical protein OJF2_52970 [Aquisphaera giovannonii]|uniref:Uncharacterized protein n=1 Tax=Aquisphaera giovannonii TaxID=406548 RepID=A0A5B9W7P7_9BACT|nr:glycosyltransferase family 39 protein [Aquisphaera giovannonii]QEH36712.1 hypothetical protein OJF2_52970 [Aquisphaera giovannonii]
MNTSGGVLAREIDPGPWIRWAREHPSTLILAAGAMLRVLLYASNREPWMDEGSLLGNIVGKGVLDFSERLSSEQLAPVGFLIVERAISQVLGGHLLALRLLPLACGLASLPLFRSLATRWLSPRAALLAMMLFAFSSDLVYYSSELKPYMGDVAVGLAALVTASACLERPRRPGALARFAAIAAASPWFSFPSVFVVAAGGAVLLADAARRRDARDIGRLAAIAVSWGIGVLGTRAYAQVMLGTTNGMYVFWNFAFPPLLPLNRPEFGKLTGIVLEVLVNPLDLVAPGLPAAFVALPVVLLVLGSVSLARRERWGFALLALPVVFSYLAAALRIYPFHGRLILGLTPGLYLVIAEGVAAIGRRLGRHAAWVVAAALLVFPVYSSILQATGNDPRDFNAHGDLHRNRFMD